MQILDTSISANYGINPKAEIHESDKRPLFLPFCFQEKSHFLGMTWVQLKQWLGNSDEVS